MELFEIKLTASAVGESFGRSKLWFRREALMKVTAHNEDSARNMALKRVTPTNKKGEIHAGYVLHWEWKIVNIEMMAEPTLLSCSFGEIRC